MSDIKNINQDMNLDVRLATKDYSSENELNMELIQILDMRLEQIKIERNTLSKQYKSIMCLLACISFAIITMMTLMVATGHYNVILYVCVIIMQAATWAYIYIRNRKNRK